MRRRRDIADAVYMAVVWTRRRGGYGEEDRRKRHTKAESPGVRAEKRPWERAGHLPAGQPGQQFPLNLADKCAGVKSIGPPVPLSLFLVVPLPLLAVRRSPRPAPSSPMMSLSPTTSIDYEQPNGKRRRTASFVGAGPSSGPAAPNGPARSEMGSPNDSASGRAAPPTPGSAASAHIPKRGARACTNCRKGKNRCEGEVSFPVILSGPILPLCPTHGPIRSSSFSGFLCPVHPPPARVCRREMGLIGTIEHSPAKSPFASRDARSEVISTSRKWYSSCLAHLEVRSWLLREPARVARLA